MKIPMIGFAFTMTACFLMTGCSGVGVGGGSTTSSNQLNTAFTTGVTMELEEMTAEGTMQRVGAGEWNVSFSEPSQLAGVRLDFQKGEVTASYKGLAFSVPQTALPAKSILYQFILAADQLAEESTLQGTSKDGGMVLSGDLEAGRRSGDFLDEESKCGSDFSRFCFQRGNIRIRNIHRIRIADYRTSVANRINRTGNNAGITGIKIFLKNA